MKAIKWISGILVLTIIVAFLLNLLTLQLPVNERIKTDSRNDGIKVRVHYKYYVIPGTLIINIKQLPSTFAPADVFRVFLLTTSTLKNKNFERVELASKGITKFFILGEYFSKLGSEYGEQNVVYTIRTFPENLYLPDGESAYSKWSGGMLGVLSQQMDDFNNMCKRWFLDDFTHD